MNRILSNNIKKVKGEWCRDCNANCESKLPSYKRNYNNNMKNY